MSDDPNFAARDIVARGSKSIIAERNATRKYIIDILISITGIREVAEIIGTYTSGQIITVPTSVVDVLMSEYFEFEVCESLFIMHEQYSECDEFDIFWDNEFCVYFSEDRTEIRWSDLLELVMSGYSPAVQEELEKWIYGSPMYDDIFNSRDERAAVSISGMFNFQSMILGMAANGDQEVYDVTSPDRDENIHKAIMTRGLKSLIRERNLSRAKLVAFLTSEIEIAGIAEIIGSYTHGSSIIVPSGAADALIYDDPYEDVNDSIFIEKSEWSGLESYFIDFVYVVSYQQEDRDPISWSDVLELVMSGYSKSVDDKISYWLNDDPDEIEVDESETVDKSVSMLNFQAAVFKLVEKY